MPAQPEARTEKVEGMKKGKEERERKRLKSSSRQYYRVANGRDSLIERTSSQVERSGADMGRLLFTSLAGITLPGDRMLPAVIVRNGKIQTVQTCQEQECSGKRQYSPQQKLVHARKTFLKGKQGNDF